nr:MAG TPA: hypothetical protein [Caudoviricetes sp.]
MYDNPLFNATVKKSIVMPTTRKNINLFFMGG